MDRSPAWSRRASSPRTRRGRTRSPPSCLSRPSGRRRGWKPTAAARRSSCGSLRVSAMNPGIYLVHKPVGQTSFALVQAFMDDRRKAGIRPDKLPVCHGGALDPFAEGLVLLLAGDATRLMHLLHPIPKTYLATVRWGVETDNGDPRGRPTAEGDPSRLSPQALDAALKPFLGWRDQVPPATSNKRVGGERAYVRAHRGEHVELPPSRVYLHEARFLSHDLPR